MVITDISFQASAMCSELVMKTYSFNYLNLKGVEGCDAESLGDSSQALQDRSVPNICP